jgi:hypothetical protein
MCGFYVALNATSPTTSMLARALSTSGGRATRFGVKPIDADKDVVPGLYADTGVSFSFEDRHLNGVKKVKASITQVELSNVVDGTVIGEMCFF